MRFCSGSAWLLLSLGLLAPHGIPGESPPKPAPKIDDATGLKMSANWELARAHCGVCHSYRLVTANRGNREYWLDMLRWMQRTQNLWPIPPEQESQLLDYLADNYNETEWGRRPPLSPSLIPTLKPMPGGSGG